MPRLRNTPRLWGAVVVCTATAAAMVWTYTSTHQIYPDTQYYIGWTLRLMGHDRVGSEQLVSDYIREHGVFTPYPDIWASLTGRLGTKPRMLLPVLSVPFVAWFGPGAIVVVPGIAFLVAMVLIYRFGLIHASAPAVAGACVLVLLSPLVVKWSVGGLTDSLALVFHTAMFLFLPWRRPATRWTVLAVAAVCALSATARLITPFTVAAMAALWLWAMLRRRERWSWTAVTAGAAAGVIAGTIWTRWASSPLTSRNQIYAMTGGRARTMREALPWYEEQVPIRLEKEWSWIVGSRPLLLLVILSLVACVTAWRTVVPWLVLPAWAGAAGIFLLNPAVTEFRYELPTLSALAVAVAVLADQAARLARWLLRRRRGGQPDPPVHAGLPAQTSLAPPAPTTPEPVRH